MYKNCAEFAVDFKKTRREFQNSRRVFQNSRREFSLCDPAKHYALNHCSITSRLLNLTSLILESFKTSLINLTSSF